MTDSAVSADTEGDLLRTAIALPSPGVAVLHVHGEADMATAPAFAQAVTELMAGQPARALVIDLTGLTFLASSGLAVLIDAARRAEKDGIRLRLVVSTRQVQRPLEITGSDTLFDVHPDLAAAIGDAD